MLNMLNAICSIYVCACVTCNLRTNSKIMDSEKLIEKTLQEKVNLMGGQALKFHCLSVSGFPDRIVLMPKGKVYFIELKSEGKKPRKLQNLWARKLKDMGFFHGVIDTMEGLRIFLKLIGHAE